MEEGPQRRNLGGNGTYTSIQNRKHSRARPANGHELEASVSFAPAQPRTSLFAGFFGAGFECSTFKRRSGQRMDFIAATEHERFAQQDYQRLNQESVRSIARAARETGTQVMWDLCHFGWPDHLELFSPDFVTALAHYGAAVAQWLTRELEEPPWFVPVNEISFFSWAAGDEGSMYPFITSRGFELKTQLVRAAIATIDAIWAKVPSARFAHVDPLIHVVASPRHPEEQSAAEAYRLSQFQAWDMLSGRLLPELGGHGRYLDVIGVNFYPHNQWFYNLKNFRRVRKFTPLSRKHPLYRPLRQLLREVYERYRRPLFIAETGAEDRARAGWLRYVCQETQSAIEQGTPLEGICLYPILNHPGWIDDRHCHNALWDYPDETGGRPIYKPLATELCRWRKVFEPKKETSGRPRNESVLTGRPAV